MSQELLPQDWQISAYRSSAAKRRDLCSCPRCCQDQCDAVLTGAPCEERACECRDEPKELNFDE